MTPYGSSLFFFQRSFMISLISAIFFAFGLCVGSFLNVVIIRGTAGERLGGRSRCRNCSKTLGVRELIPVASYILQSGRCRGCHALISLQYPLVELATAGAFAVIAWYFAPSLYGENGSISAQALLGLGFTCAVAGAGLAILISDLRFQLIPDGATASLALAGLFFSYTRGSVAPDLAAALACVLFFFLLWFVSGGRWMGFGDVKLVAATSLLVGYPAAIAAALFAFWLGGITGALLLLGGGKQWGSRIPFGPFILAGAVAAWLWGDAFFTFIGLAAML